MKLKRPSGNIELETNSDDELPDRNSTLYHENNIISKTYYKNTKMSKYLYTQRVHCGVYNILKYKYYL